MALWPGVGGSFSTGPLNKSFQPADKVSWLNYAPQTVGGELTAAEAAQKITNHYSNLASFFGHPNKRPDVNPHDLYDVEHEHLPDAYKGRNVTLTNIMIDQLKASDMYMFTELFPLIRQEGSMTVEWNKMIFEHPRLNRQPEEMVPRLMVYNHESGQESMVRFGIGLMLEHGFYNTRLGIQTYLMHLQQIRNAIAETMAHGAAVAAIEHVPFRDNKNTIYGQSGPSSYEQLRNRFGKELRNWAIANKRERGLKDAERQLKKTLSDRGVPDGDYVVYPQGLIDLLPEAEVNALAIWSGKAGVPSLESVKGQFFKDKIRRESRGYKQPDHNAPDDPFFKRQSIGNYFSMVNYHLRDVPVDEYRTSMMDTFIFSRTLNNKKRISFKEAVPMGGLWDWNSPGRIWSELGRDFFTGARGRNEFGNDKEFHSWGEFCEHTGTLQKITESIVDLKRPERGPTAFKNLLTFIKKFDPKLEVVGGGGGSNEFKNDDFVDGTAHFYGSGKVGHKKNKKKYHHHQVGADGDVVSSAGAAPGASELHDRAIQDVELPPKDVEKIIRWINEREAAVSRSNPGEESAVKLSYQNLREFLTKLSERETDPLAVHYVQRKFSIMDEYSPLRFSLDAARAPVSEKEKHPQLKIAQYAYHFTKNTEETPAIFSEVFFKLQPGLYELDVDMSLEYIRKHRALTGGLTPYEELLSTESNVGKSDPATKDKFRSANDASPSFSVDYHASGPPTRRGGLFLPITLSLGPSPKFHIPRERDSEAFTLTSHFLPLFYVSPDAVRAVCASSDKRAGAIRLFHGKDEPNVHRIVASQFSVSMSLVVAYLSEESEKHASRLKEYKASSSHAPVAAAAAKGGKKGPANAAEEKESSESPHSAYVNLEPDYEELTRHVIDLICLNPTNAIDRRTYKELLEQMNIFEASPLAVQFQLRHVIKKARELVWSLVNDTKPTASVAAHVKDLYHVIKRTMLVGPDQQLLSHSTPASSSGKKSSVGMDLAFRRGEFSGDFSDGQLEEMKQQSHQRVKALYDHFLASAHTDDRKLAVKAAFEPAHRRGWVQFFNTLYIVVMGEKSVAYTQSERSVHFDLLVTSFIELLISVSPEGSLVQKDEGISLFLEAAGAYPLGPIASWLTQASAKPADEKAKFIVSKVYAAAAEYPKMQAISSRVIDNRYFSVDKQISDLANLRSADEGASNLGEAIAAASFAFKPFLQSVLRVNDVESALAKKKERELISLVWNDFAGNLPQAVHEWTEGEEERKRSVAMWLYRSFLGAPVARRLFPGVNLQTISDQLFAAKLAPGGLLQSSDSLSDVYEERARNITEVQVQGILYKTGVSSGDFMAFCLDADIWSPLGVLGFRPHASFLMSTLLYANRGRAGQTWYGHCDFQLADDIMRKMHLGNYTQYHKTIIPYTEHLCLFRNIAVHNYLGGDGHEFWNPLNPRHKEHYASGNIFRDIFIVLVPANHDPNKSPFMDITGNFSDALGTDSECQTRTEYFSAKAYSRHWGWRHSRGTYNANDGIAGAKQPRGNTLCFQTQQELYLYNPARKITQSGIQSIYGVGDFVLHIPDAGHWGDENIYPGCMEVVYGNSQLFTSASPAINMRPIANPAVFSV